MDPSAWPDRTALPSGDGAHETTYESEPKSVVDLLLRSAPSLSLPSWQPKTSSLGRADGHARHVTGDDWGNLLQMLFLSAQSRPWQRVKMGE